MSNFSIVIDCPVCKQKHEYKLDASGHYDGNVPCDKTKHVRLQVEPQQWRDLQDRRRAETKH